MAVTPDGGLAFMMERSSRQETQSLQIAGGMPPGPLQTAIASPSNGVVNGTDRWGDYTDLAYDFSDGTMWAIGEYQVHSLLPGIPMGPQKIAPLAGWWSTFVVNFKLVK
jgi:hypothetical protein